MEPVVVHRTMLFADTYLRLKTLEVAWEHSTDPEELNLIDDIMTNLHASMAMFCDHFIGEPE